MSAETYYYICDNCGSIADIGDKHPEDGPEWACADCDSSALWEFTDKDKAVLHGRHIQDKLHAARMAGIDQAKALSDEMQGCLRAEPDRTAGPRERRAREDERQAARPHRRYCSPEADRSARHRRTDEGQGVRADRLPAKRHLRSGAAEAFRWGFTADGREPEDAGREQ